MNQYASKILTKLLGAVYLAVGVWFSVNHSTAPLVVTVCFALVAGLAYASEVLWLSAWAPILVLTSLYPLTGELLFTEQDIGLCGLLGGRLLGIGKAQPLFSSIGMLWYLAALVWLVAGIHGWASLPNALPGDQLGLYTTRLNALYQSKSLFYAIGLVPLLIGAFKVPSAADMESCWRAVTFGFELSAVGVCVAVIAERFVTIGLWDWDRELRAAGPCMTMHIGDQHIDAFWAIALPFLLQFRQGSKFASSLQCLLLIGVAYAIFATMSRATIAATFVMAAVIVVAKVTYFKPVVERRQRGMFLGSVFKQVSAGLVGLVMLVSISLVLWYAGDAVPKRFASTTEGLATRVQHWSTVCQMIGSTNAKLWVGSGLGTYPLEFRRKVGRPEQPIGLVKSADMTGVRLVAGEAIFAAQLVSPKAPLPWEIDLTLRRSSPDCEINVMVCHQVLLQSNECVIAKRLSTQPGANGAEQVSYALSELPDNVLPREENQGRLWSPTALSFFASGRSAEWIEVFDWKVVDAGGNAILKNPDFRDGSQYWFFVSDDHLIWRAKNSFLHLGVETGLIGIVLFVLLGASLLFKCFAAAFRQRQWVAFVVTLSILGFMPIGMFGTLIDTPWISLLLLMQLAIAQGISQRIALLSSSNQLAGSDVWQAESP
jgi:hypothetical protein